MLPGVRVPRPSLRVKKHGSSHADPPAAAPLASRDPQVDRKSVSSSSSRAALTAVELPPQPHRPSSRRHRHLLRFLLPFCSDPSNNEPAAPTLDNASPQKANVNAFESLLRLGMPAGTDGNCSSSSTSSSGSDCRTSSSSGSRSPSSVATLDNDLSLAAADYASTLEHERDMERGGAHDAEGERESATAPRDEWRAMGSLIPGLPDDLGVEVLLRVRRSEHANARTVCRQWRDLMTTQEYYNMRRTRGLQEGWLYVLSRDKADRLWWRALDPAVTNSKTNCGINSSSSSSNSSSSIKCSVSSGKWYNVPRMPGEAVRSYGMTCSASDGNLYVIGGAGWFKPSKAEVFRFNPPSAMWERVADMQMPRCYSVSGAIGGRIYVAGGMGSTTTSMLASAESYDPKKDQWSPIANLPVDGDLEEAAVMNGSLLVRHARCEHAKPGPSTVRYDPTVNTWEKAESPMEASWHGPSAVAAGRMYMLDQIGGVKLMESEPGAKGWRLLGRLPACVLTPPCRLQGMQDRLYVVGRGASMLVVDLEQSRRARARDEATAGQETMLVTQRVDGVGCPSDVVVSCVVVDV